MSLSRKWIADTLQVAPETIYFTSGGTESDNWALMFAVSASKKVCATYITTAIEHHAILNTCKNLEKSGVRVTLSAGNRNGIVLPETR